jgi:mono/diheme cytochrome c family protein
MPLKRLLQVVGILLSIALLALVIVLLHGRAIRTQHVNRAVSDFPVNSDSIHIARGAHLAALTCASCHASTDPGRPLSGGRDNILAIPDGPTFGVLYPPNLTPAGVLPRYPSDGLLARAIREGVGWDGRALLVMPSAQFRRISDDDLGALIAWLRTQPPVAHELPAPSNDLLGYLVLGLHMYPNSLQPPVTRPVPSVPIDSTAHYGEYVSYILGCRDCHGPTLHGGRKGQLAPLGPDLVALATTHPQSAFDHAVRGGVSPSGTPLNPNLMPWTVYSGLDDLEVTALYRYLSSLR